MLQHINMSYDIKQIQAFSSASKEKEKLTPIKVRYTMFGHDNGAFIC